MKTIEMIQKKNETEKYLCYLNASLIKSAREKLRAFVVDCWYAGIRHDGKKFMRYSDVLDNKNEETLELLNVATNHSTYQNDSKLGVALKDFYGKPFEHNGRTVVITKRPYGCVMLRVEEK